MCDVLGPRELKTQYLGDPFPCLGAAPELGAPGKARRGEGKPPERAGIPHWALSRVASRTGIPSRQSPQGRWWSPWLLPLPYWGGGGMERGRRGRSRGALLSLKAPRPALPAGLSSVLDRWLNSWAWSARGKSRHLRRLLLLVSSSSGKDVGGVRRSRSPAPRSPARRRGGLPSPTTRGRAQAGAGEALPLPRSRRRLLSPFPSASAPSLSAALGLPGAPGAPWSGRSRRQAPSARPQLSSRGPRVRPPPSSAWKRREEAASRARPGQGGGERRLSVRPVPPLPGWGRRRGEGGAADDEGESAASPSPSRLPGRRALSGRKSRFSAKRAVSAGALCRHPAGTEALSGRLGWVAHRSRAAWTGWVAFPEDPKWAAPKDESVRSRNYSPFFKRAGGLKRKLK